jgi:uncharacterized membrane protein YqjE
VIHPFLRKLVTEPELFVEHASAYAELASAQARQVGQLWRRRAALLLLAFAFAAVALVLSGVAALLAAALPWQQMPAPGVLIVLPALLWLVAAGAAWAGWKTPQPEPFGCLRQQWAADAQLMRDVAQAS